MTGIVISDSPPMRAYDAVGARFETSSRTTVTPTAVTTVTTFTRTSNPCLPMLGGVAEVREKIGSFVGVLVGAELRCRLAVGPALAEVVWADHDGDHSS